MLKKMLGCIILLGIGAAACEKSTVEGPGEKQLTLVKPANQTIEQGKTNEVSIMVNRDNFSAPVRVEFGNLPSGVTVEDNGGVVEGSQRNFVLKASDTASLVGDHVATVTAQGPDGMAVTEQFTITVRAKG